MKIVKMAVVVIVIIGALFFIYMTVEKRSAQPATPVVDETRMKLERAMQASPPNVDPKDRQRLENFMRGLSSTSTSATEDDIQTVDTDN